MQHSINCTDCDERYTPAELAAKLSEYTPVSERQVLEIAANGKLIDAKNTISVLEYTAYCLKTMVGND